MICIYMHIYVCVGLSVLGNIQNFVLSLGLGHLDSIEQK